MNKLLSILFVTLFFSQNSFAWGLKEVGEEAASPATTNAKYVLLGGTLLTLAVIVTEDQLADPFQKQTVKDHPLKSSSQFGNYFGQMLPNALYIGGMAIASQYGDTQGKERAIGMLKATLYSAAVTTVLKYSIREPRPNDHSTRNSFPSGHTTTAFAFAGYVASEHGWAWGAPALLMSTFTAYSRINDNAHRLQDVVAGATVGWVYGWGINQLQKKNKTKENEKEAYIAPILDARTAGLSLYKEF